MLTVVLIVLGVALGMALGGGAMWAWHRTHPRIVDRRPPPAPAPPGVTAPLVARAPARPATPPVGRAVVLEAADGAVESVRVWRGAWPRVLVRPHGRGQDTVYRARVVEGSRAYFRAEGGCDGE